MNWDPSEAETEKSILCGGGGQAGAEAPVERRSAWLEGLSEQVDMSEGWPGQTCDLSATARS